MQILLITILKDESCARRVACHDLEKLELGAIIQTYLCLQVLVIDRIRDTRRRGQISQALQPVDIRGVAENAPQLILRGVSSVF